MLVVRRAVSLFGRPSVVVHRHYCLLLFGRTSGPVGLTTYETVCVTMGLAESARQVIVDSENESYIEKGLLISRKRGHVIVILQRKGLRVYGWKGGVRRIGVTCSI